MYLFRCCPGTVSSQGSCAVTTSVSVGSLTRARAPSAAPSCLGEGSGLTPRGPAVGVAGGPRARAGWVRLYLSIYRPESYTEKIRLSSQKYKKLDRALCTTTKYTVHAIVSSIDSSVSVPR